MEIVKKQTTELIPYVNNPRVNNDESVDKVASSIKNFGFKVPLVIDTENEIVAGHTRLKAAKKLGIEEVPCIVAADLTEDQIKAYRIADNRVAEESEWDFELLNVEIEGILDFDETDLGFDEDELSEFIEDAAEEELETSYTDKIQVPTYEPNNEKPDIEDVFDTSKAMKLISDIEDSNLPKKEKEFLKFAAYRHVVFDYREIAEYYAQSDEEIQGLMEDSALVIIDYNKAIENGFVDFVSNVMEEGENDG